MRKCVVHFLIAAVLLLSGCKGVPIDMTPAGTQPAVPTRLPSTATPTPSAPTMTLTPAATVVPSPDTLDSRVLPYGVVYPYEKTEWGEADRQDIRTQLAYLKTLGVNTVVQIFSSRPIGSGQERDWLIFLDEAANVNIHVMARLWPLTDGGMDYPAIGAFLAVVKDHPALLAYLGLHEPLEQFDSAQLRDFYSQVKEIAPEVPLANYMGTMAWFDKNVRFPNRNFSPGICDLCIVWYYPVRYRDGQPDFEEDQLRATLQDNRMLVTARAPESQMWVLGQVYAQTAHPRQLRMSTPEEMARIYAIAVETGADGFLWYPWFHANYDETLGDPEMEAQRQKVYDIYTTSVLTGQTP